MKLQKGQAMVEMIVVSFVALLLLFSIIQFALLYNAKTILNYAVFEAARVGSLNYSHPLSMRLALAQKLAVLEPVKSAVNDGNNEILAARQMNLLEQLGAGESSLFDSIACIKRLNPPASKGHWQSNTLAAQTSKSIANDHLLYRDATPKGDQAQSIQDANLLKISVTYCPKMIVPIVSTAVKRLMLVDYYNADPDKIEGWDVTKNPIDFNKQCYENDRFPMQAQAVIRMQTPVGLYSYQDSDCEGITTLASQLGAGVSTP